jgi:hypothetical protein
MFVMCDTGGDFFGFAIATISGGDRLFGLVDWLALVKLWFGWYVDNGRNLSE